MDLESVCVHLVKEAVDLCECVCNWQVEELGKVLQTQPVSLQLSGSSGLLLQHFVCSSCSQPVNTQKYKEIKSCSHVSVIHTVNNICDILCMGTKFCQLHFVCVYILYSYPIVYSGLRALTHRLTLVCLSYIFYCLKMYKLSKMYVQELIFIFLHKMLQFKIKT